MLFPCQTFRLYSYAVGLTMHKESSDILILWLCEKPQNWTISQSIYVASC